MSKLILSGIVCTILLGAMPGLAFAHGGQYRGPGDVVPPNPGGGGGRTPGPSGPSGPGAAGPRTPGPGAGPTTPGGGMRGGLGTGAGPAAPSAGGRGPITGGGIRITSDLGRWQFWWEFNKDPFINLKEAIHAGEITTGGADFFMGGTRMEEGTNTLKPTEAQIMGQILPALKQALDRTDNRDITSSCLVAMAKIGKDHEDFRILPLMKAELKSPDQEIRETAAVSMGISQMTAAISDLVELAKDTPAGRKLCDQPEVDNRTRSFACYGLGLIAWATSDPDLKRQVFEALKAVLEQSTSPLIDRNVPVAAINSIRLLRPDPDGGEKGKKLLEDCLATLMAYYDKDAGEAEQMIQAHVPPAVAELLGRGGDGTGEYKQRFADELAGKYGDRANAIYQSAAIALGLLCEPPPDSKSGDAKYCRTLLSYYRNGSNEQARSFCLMALGQIGGDVNRNELLKIFDRGSKAIVKPWAALSLGVQTFQAREAGKQPSRIVGQTLHRAIMDIENPETKAAIAVSLGLAGYTPAADDMRALLRRYKHQDELAGYLCIGLALMDDQRSIDLIRELVATSVRRPELLQQAAIALGKLGDKGVTGLLQGMLEDSAHQTVATLTSIASALGYIGDRRTIAPLINLLQDEALTPLSRAFAAVALGGVADKEPLPWNSKIACHMNYRAAVETLTNGATGILDIL